MGFYHHNFPANHMASVSCPNTGAKFEGWLKDSSFSFGASHSVDNSGSWDLVGGISKAIGIDKAASAIGMNLEDFQMSKTIKMPKKFDSPKMSLSISQVSGGPKGWTYRKAMEQVAKIVLPTTHAQMTLWSNQMEFSDFLKIKAADASSGLTTLISQFSLDKGLCTIRVGNFFNASGFWITDAKVSTPSKFDANGQPVQWDIEFNFEYWRQVDDSVFKSWFVSQGS